MIYQPTGMNSLAFVWTVTLVIVTTICAPIQAARDANEPFFEPQEVLDRLCKDKDFSLHRLSELELLVRLLNERKVLLDGCKREVVEAILVAGGVVADNSDVCSREKAQLITYFHYTYISTQRNDNLRKYAPKALRRFMIAYGLNVSRICKKNLVNNLIQDSHSLLRPEDFELMNIFTNDKYGILSKLNGKPQDFDDIVLANDLLYIYKERERRNNLESEEDRHERKIFMKASRNSKVHLMQSACDNRFKPFYDKLILPLVRLADIGYNYKGEDMRVELDEIKNNPEISNWYSLVYFCEILSSVELVEMPEEEEEEEEKKKSSQKTEDSDPNSIELKILTIDEIRNIDTPVLKMPSSRDMPLIRYTSREGSTSIEEDKLIDEEDQNFVQLVKRFDASLTPFNRIKNKIFAKVGVVMKEFLKSGIVNIKNKSLEESIGAGSQRQALMSAIDSYIKEEEEQEQGQFVSLDGLPLKGVSEGKYGIKRADGSVSELKEKKVSAWNAHRIKMIIYPSILIAIVVVVIVAMGLTAAFG